MASYARERAPFRGPFLLANCQQVGRGEGRRPFLRPTFRPPQRPPPLRRIISPRPHKEAPHPQGGWECARHHSRRVQPPGLVGGPLMWREREPLMWPDRCPEWMRPVGYRLSGALLGPQKKGGRRPPGRRICVTYANIRSRIRRICQPSGPHFGGAPVISILSRRPQPKHPRDGHRSPGNGPHLAATSSGAGKQPRPRPRPPERPCAVAQPPGLVGGADDVATAGAAELARPLPRVAEPWRRVVWLRLAAGRCSRPSAIVQPSHSGGGRGRGRGYSRPPGRGVAVARGAAPGPRPIWRRGSY